MKSTQPRHILDRKMDMLFLKVITQLWSHILAVQLVPAVNDDTVTKHCFREFPVILSSVLSQRKQIYDVLWL